MNDKMSSSLIHPNDWIKFVAFDEEEDGGEVRRKS